MSAFYEDVLIDGHRTYTDWGLVLGECRFPAPDVKELYAEAPAADGEPDLTEVNAGRPVYKNRTVEMEFSRPCQTRQQGRALYRLVRSLLHGVYCTIVSQRWGGGSMVGRVRVSDESLEGTVLKLAITATCRPFIYTGERSVELEPTQSETVSGGRVELDPEPFAAGAALIKVHRALGDYGPALNALRLEFAAGDNWFDPSAALFAGKSLKRGGSWTIGVRPYVEGQSVCVGEPTVDYCNRAVLSAGAISGVSNTPVFPLLGVRGQSAYVNIWIYSDEVTAVGTAFNNINPGVTVRYVERPADKVGSDGVATMGTFGYIGHLDPPSVGSSYSGARIGGNLPIATGQIYIDAAWMRCGYVYAAIAVSDGPLDEWEAAEVLTEVVSLPGPLRATDTAYDEYVASPASARLTRRTTEGPNPSRPVDSDEYTVECPAIAWPDISPVVIQAHLVSGNVPVDDPDGPLVEVTEWELGEVAVQNTSMPATPSIACDTDTVVTIGGVKVATPAGASQLLPVTVERGAQTIEYAVLGDDAAELTWMAGEL